MEQTPKLKMNTYNTVCEYCGEIFISHNIRGKFCKHKNCKDCYHNEKNRKLSQNIEVKVLAPMPTDNLRVLVSIDNDSHKQSVSNIESNKPVTSSKPDPVKDESIDLLDFFCLG